MQRALLWAAPGLFVVLWSTGFIGARLGLPYSEPFWFLVVRFGAVIGLLAILAVIFRLKWPSPMIALHNMVSGILVHACYLGGVFFAIDRGMSAGVSSLIVSMQPILTLMLASLFLGEKVSLRTWGLFGVGLTGVYLVLMPVLSGTEQAMPTSALVSILVALLGLTLGTIYQKRFGGSGDLLTKLAVQYVGATVVLFVASMVSEQQEIIWHMDFIIAILWLVIVLSLGATGLLMFLINRDSVSRTSALFFLVPGFTVVVANLLFEETLVPVQIAGLLLATIAVALVARRA